MRIARLQFLGFSVAASMLALACGSNDVGPSIDGSVAETDVDSGSDDASVLDSGADSTVDSTLDSTLDSTTDAGADSAVDSVVDSTVLDGDSGAVADSGLDSGVDSASNDSASNDSATASDAADAADASDASGVCATVTCTALDACHVAGTCNPVTGACSNPPAADGTSCDDHNACTQTDTCQAGVCTGSHPVTCTALDACHVAGTCDPTSGCSNPSVADGTPCTATAACTLNATCQAGTCTGTACSTGLCGTSLTAFNGTKTANWSFNGSATYDATANTVVLTDGVTTAEAGTVVYKDPITVDTFTASFDFKLDSVSGRADGIVFMLETNGASALGGGYGGFGALGLTGYGVEFDIFDSGPCDPGNGNHAGVDLLSACGTNAGIPSAVATSPDLYTPIAAGDNGVGDIADGQWRTATIHVAAGAVDVSITDPTTTQPVAIPNLQGVMLPGFVAGTPYYLGLGGGSGSNGLAAHQQIRNVQVTFPSQRCL